MTAPPPQTVPRKTEWILTGLLAANLIWTTICLGGYRPETMVVTSFLHGLTLAVWLGDRALRAHGPQMHPAGWAVLPFLVYAAGNVLWITPVRWLGWHDWLWWAQAATVFWVVMNGVPGRRPRLLLLGTLALLGGVAVVLAAYQRFVHPEWLMLGRIQSEQFLGRASGPFGIPNSLAALLLLLLPASLALTFRRGAPAVQRVLFGYLGAVYAFGLVLTISRGAWLALAAMLSLWPWFALRRRRAVRIGAVALAALVCLAAGWGLYRTLPGVEQRFVQMAQESGEWTRPIMWRGAWKLFQEQPWVGTGAGSYNVLFEKYRPENYQMEPQWAHNDYLNTLSDYGALGFALSFGVLVVLALRAWWRRAKHAPRAGGLEPALLRQGLGIGLGAFMLQLLVDFHFKIPALAATAAVVAAVLTTPRTALVPVSRGSRFLSAGLLLAVLLGMVTFVLPHYRAEAARYAARQTLDTLWRTEPGPDYRMKLQRAVAGLESAVRLNPAHAQAWADLAYATTLRAHAEPGTDHAALGREAERLADRALALSEVVPDFWIRRAIARDMQGQWLPAGSDLIQALQLAPANAWVWYYHAYHLSLNPTSLPLARAAVAYSLRLDPSNHSAQLLRQQLAISD